jgi:hypothetical protein
MLHLLHRVFPGAKLLARQCRRSRGVLSKAIAPGRTDEYLLDGGDLPDEDGNPYENATGNKHAHHMANLL